MLASITVLMFISSSSASNDHMLHINQDKQHLLDCIVNVTEQYFAKGEEITYFDINSDDNQVLQVVNNNMHVSLISRTQAKRLKTVQNVGYVIFAKHAKELVEKFTNFTREPQWNPYARFLIIISTFDTKLEHVFNVLLKFHVVNVVIVNGTGDCDLYTYDPFENNGCGKKYARIIQYGKCRQPAVTNLFPNKLVAGLRNCTITIGAPHWPPYSIDPNKNTTKLTGIEQYMFQIISELEHFKVQYVYSDDAENFTTVSDDMSVVGPLALLQFNKVDIILGGMMLIESRANAFDYIWSHLAYVDDLRIMVKRATDVASWKNVYLEFEFTVWMLLTLAFVIYSILFFALFSVKDKHSVMLKMWDSFFQHGHVIHGRFPIRCFFISWIWFAFLVNSYYQSSLVSLSTHPAKDYQISKEEDLRSYNVKACVCPAIETFQLAEGMKPYLNEIDGCDDLLESINMVSQYEGVFTLTISNIYLYYKHEFYNAWGTPSIYYFPKPISKVIFAVYLYKGFPVYERLHTVTLRLRESGLLSKITYDLYYEQTLMHYFHQKPLHLSLIIPWYIYVFGICLSVAVFVLEIVVVKLRIRHESEH
ncbi:uncharacterized protein LOC131846204 [Achroia grisella]|uniref:uncharacterized protein LOC131846204 n=1 Tax=Achroia grisella TaxID=688607 RepID=UPI0027D2CDD6|nr:uncharacterized protein LOC131846204 [Achroia grisella]